MQVKPDLCKSALTNEAMIRWICSVKLDVITVRLQDMFEQLRIMDVNVINRDKKKKKNSFIVMNTSRAINIAQDLEVSGRLGEKPT